MSDDKFSLSCGCEVQQHVGFLYVCPAHKDLIAREREACAAVADLWSDNCGDCSPVAKGIAEQIRARA